MKRKVGFQLWSANLVFAFIGDRQAKIVGCACSKRKCMVMNIVMIMTVKPWGL